MKIRTTHKPSVNHERIVPLPPDPVIERYKQDVDRASLRENLKLTVEQRFEKLKNLQRFASELREAGRKAAHDGL